ncbi:CPBP family glutamic-type intramembrane protease [Chryseobacterium flavum]|uniref:CPBP family glutamic-type intramembrane protease n=1 Tax=Chryseobacterium flavum TaxID=415851 RepID=UPI0035E4358F
MKVLADSFFFSVILGPVLEEILFRLWLVYNKINISITIVCFLLWINGLVFNIYWFDNYKFTTYFILTFIVLFICSLYLFKKYEKVKTFNFWNKNQKTFIIISCMLFGAAHIGNYTGNNNSIEYYFITFAPQISFGFILCYMRIRIGFGASLTTHSLNNFIPLILSAFTC